MANKTQINCSPGNKLKIEIFKNEKRRLQNNIETIKALEIEIKQLKESNVLNIPIQDPYHPSYNQYNQAVNLLKEFKQMVFMNKVYLGIYEESITASTS